MTTTDFFVPRSIAEAVQLRREHGSELVVMGGGTIVMQLVNDGVLFPRLAMSLRHAGLDGVRNANGHVEIGATTTAAALTRLDALPALAQAAGALGGPALRNMATIGGNLFARPPYGDLAVALLALDAQVGLRGSEGPRTIPLEEFFTGTVGGVAMDRELITALHVPRPPGRSIYLKLGRRQANTPSVVAVAIHLLIDGHTCSEACVALGSTGPRPLRARQAEAALTGRQLDQQSIAAASEAAMDDCEPFTDALASAWYRRKMVGVYVRRALESLMS